LVLEFEVDVVEAEVELAELVLGLTCATTGAIPINRKERTTAVAMSVFGFDFMAHVCSG
jgi:fructose-specific phosphotransferase system IIC component